MSELTHPLSQPTLTSQLERELEDLYVRGTPENTLRAYERDLLYITAWKQHALGAPLIWPEEPETALRFVLDHARDLSNAAQEDPARQSTQALIDLGLRRSLNCPASSTLDRRIASWRAFHAMRNLTSPFEAPLVRQARGKARRANARPRAPKSAHPITRDVLEALLAACGPSLRGLRDQAILMLAFASGGRRRSELTSLMRSDISLDEFESRGIVWISMLETKTTKAGTTPRLILKGRAARVLVGWIDAARIDEGPLFRAVSKADRPLKRRMNPDAIRTILRRRLVQAGYEVDFASPHGLRSGFLTQAAIDGAPIQAAMKLSLHRSVAQAQQYYEDVEIEDNPATNLLE